MDTHTIFGLKNQQPKFFTVNHLQNALFDTAFSRLSVS